MVVEEFYYPPYGGFFNEVFHVKGHIKGEEGWLTG